jgi:hypothetical protein
VAQYLGNAINVLLLGLSQRISQGFRFAKSWMDTVPRSYLAGWMNGLPVTLLHRKANLSSVYLRIHNALNLAELGQGLGPTDDRRVIL